jgi:acyl carrier protein
MTTDIDQRVTTHLAIVTRSQPGRLTDQERLVDVGLDSLSLLELLVRIERDFGLTIADRAVLEANLVTVADLVHFVDDQLVGTQPMISSSDSREE